MLGCFCVELTRPESGAAVLIPRVRAGHQFILAPMKDIPMARSADGLANRAGHRFALEFLQDGLELEGIDLGGAAHHEEKDDGTRPGSEIGLARGKWVQRVKGRTEEGGCGSGCRESRQGAESKGAKASAHARKEIAARPVAWRDKHGGRMPESGLFGQLKALG